MLKEFNKSGSWVNLWTTSLFFSSFLFIGLVVQQSSFHNLFFYISKTLLSTAPIILFLVTQELSHQELYYSFLLPAGLLNLIFVTAGELYLYYIFTTAYLLTGWCYLNALWISRWSQERSLLKTLFSILITTGRKGNGSVIGPVIDLVKHYFFYSSTGSYKPNE